MVDVNTQLGAVERSIAIATPGVDGAPMNVQTLAQTYRATLADTWDAVTTSDRIRRWFLPIEGDLRVGGRYQLEGNAAGSIEECVPPQGAGAHFRVTWEYGGGAPGRLTIALTELAPESTRLELRFEGRADGVPAEMWEQFGPSATGIGWDQGLLGLALHLHHAPDGVAPEDAAAWSMSDEGKAFLRGAADAWARAHVAAGASEAIAQAAADTTYAMYAGEAPEAM